MTDQEILDVISKIIMEELSFHEMYKIDSYLCEKYRHDVVINYWKDESNSFAERDMIREDIRKVLSIGGWNDEDDQRLTKALEVIKSRVKNEKITFA